MDFYKKAAIVDRLKGLTSVSLVDQSQLIDLISESPVREYFFTGLNNPAWFRPLLESGVFSAPPPPVTSAGKTSIPNWDVLDYLIEMAPTFPEEITQIVESIPPHNSRVLGGCVRIGRRLPATYTSRLVPIVARWLSAEHFMVTTFEDEIGTWIEHLSNGGRDNSGLELLRILTAPGTKILKYLSVDGSSGRERVEAVSLINPYHFEHLLGKPTSILVAKMPFDVAELLQNSLRQAIEMESSGKEEYDFSYLWRPAIEEHPQNWGFKDFKDVVCVALRDTLQECSKNNLKRTKEYLNRLLRHKYAIFTRLALHTIQTNKESFREEGEALLLEPNNYYNHLIHHEFLLLLGAMFGDLADPHKAFILNLLRNPREDDVVDKEAAPEVQQRQKTYWSATRLAIIKDHLTEGDRADLEKMLATVGPLEHPTFLTYHESSFGESVPKSSEEQKELSPEEVLQYMRELKLRPGFKEPTPAGVARTLSQDVKGLPPDYLTLVHSYLLGKKPSYIYVFIEQLDELRKGAQGLKWDLTLTILDELIRVSPPPPNSDRDESGWDYASVRRRVADLMDAWLRHNLDRHVPFDLREKAWRIVDFLCHDPEPNESHEEEFGNTNMNPPTLCINTTRGKGMHALMEYALWYAHYTKDAAAKEGDVERFDPKVKALLSEKLDKDQDASAAVHSTFGQFLPNLFYLDSKWTRERLQLIFPKERRYWKSAWGSYVCFNRVYPKLYDLLVEQYLGAIALLPDEPIFLDRSALSPERALAEHLMVAYLNDLDTLNATGRIHLFFRNANDHQRAAAIAFIGDVAKRERLFGTTNMWQKAMTLWNSRLDQALADQVNEPHQEEFDAFLGWAEEFVSPLSQMYLPIKLSISLCKPSWRLKALLQYIGVHSPGEELKAIDLLERLMRTLGREGLWWCRDEIGVILTACVKSELPEVRRIAVEAINQFGEWGVYDYRDLLPLASQP